MDKECILVFFKKKRVLEHKKIQEQMIEIAKEYLSGKINFEEFKKIFLENDQILFYFSDFSMKNSRRKFYSKAELFRLDNTYWVRHDLYNQMYSFLYIIGIEFDEYVPEYAIYRKIDKLCPEWFQQDIKFLQKQFENLEELISEKQLEKALRTICKSENGEMPQWLQGAEWPIVNDKPAIFVKQSMLPDEMDFDDFEIEYYFIDDDNNEIVVKQNT